MPQGTQYLTYGASHCSRCTQYHQARYHLLESRESRFRLLQFVAEMSGYSARRTDAKAWNEMGTKEEKLAALRSMRGGVPLIDTTAARYGGADARARIVGLLRGKQGGLTLPEIKNELGLKEKFVALHLKGRPEIERDLDDNRLRNLLDVLAKSGNIEVQGDKPKKYLLRETGPSQGIAGVAAETSGEFMIGILICPEKTFVAASGPGFQNSKFRAVAQQKAYTVCRPRTAETTPRTTIFGAAISHDEYASAKDATAGEPGTCAAPRLIQEATEDPATDTERHEDWRMSEIYYLPNNDRRIREQNENDLYWLHGVTAHSCKTCEKLVPLLLCPKGTQRPVISLPGSPS